MCAMRRSDSMVGAVKFTFEYVPHHFYEPCLFCTLGPDVRGSGKAVLRPQKDFTRPGLKRRIGQKIEDGTPRKAGVTPDEREVQQKGTLSGYLEHTISVKKEPDEPKVNSFVEVDDVIKEEVDDPSPPTSIVPYLEMGKYVTIDMPTL